MATTHIALLRGINVGGKHRLPMKDLQRFFVKAGCSDVATYIQSGNVVFGATAAIAKTASVAVPKLIAKHCGFDAPVVVRSATRLAQLVATHPLEAPKIDPKFLAVACLSGRPGKTKLGQLDPARIEPDQFSIDGSDIYLRYPNGMARSKLTTAYLDRTLGLVSTIRNWKTMHKLHQLCLAR